MFTILIQSVYNLRDPLIEVVPDISMIYALDKLENNSNSCIQN